VATRVPRVCKGLAVTGCHTDFSGSSSEHEKIDEEEIEQRARSSILIQTLTFTPGRPKLHVHV
jgi:hypothetical protein